MSLQDIAVWILLALGTTATLLACLGVLLMSRFYAKLHYVGLAAVPGTVLYAAAVAVSAGASPATTKAILAALAVGIASPVLGHATARAARVRELRYWSAVPAGTPEPSPAERGE